MTMKRTVSPARLLMAAVLPATVWLAAPAAGAGAALTHAPNHRLVNSTSSNWSGYASTATTFTSVSASWVQPAATCSRKGTAYSSFWVGIDGDNSNTVEQTGTDADCRNGRPQYYGWYEMYPAFPVNFSNPVAPGDQFSASVSTSGGGAFTLTLHDATRGWTQTENLSSTTAALSSAEIIAEAPSSGNKVLPLANFGTVAFTSARANNTAIGSLSPDEITMASGRTVKAQPSPLTSGTNFSVQWEHS